MNNLLLIIFLVFFAPFVYAQKVTSLPSDTSPTTDDLIMTVDDVAGVPTNKKVLLSDVKTLILTGNASTATALAANGTNCSAGSYPLGVDSSGNAESCTASPVASNPSASIGTSAVNGSASSFMRSDAAPALSQAISPTWTGNHTFTPASGNTIFTAGNVGINSATPTSNLEVNGGFKQTGETNLNFIAGATYLTHAIGHGDGFGLGVNGNVGIGTTSNVAPDTNTASLLVEDTGTGGNTMTLWGSTTAKQDIVGSLTGSGLSRLGVGSGQVTVSVYGSGTAGNTSAGYAKASLASIAVNNRPLAIETDDNFGIDFATNATKAMTITNGQNVGIGTTIPQGALVVMNGNVGIGTWKPASSLAIAGGNGVSIGASYANQTAGAGGLIMTGNLGIGTTLNTTSALTVMNGNVGIGTWKPAYSLDLTTPLNGNALRLTVPASDGSSYDFYLGNSAATSYVRANPTIMEFSRNGAASEIRTVGSTNNLKLTGSPNVVMQATSGNVGIGSSSPDSRLSVNGASGARDFTVLANGFKVMDYTSRSNGDGTTILTYGTGGTDNFYIYRGSIESSNAAWAINGNDKDFKPATDNTASIGSPSNRTTSLYTYNLDAKSNALILGNVGIGTGSMQNSLNIVGNVGIGTVAGGSYMSTSAPSGGMLVEGNVGIGTLAASYKLDVFDGTFGNAFRVQQNASTSLKYAARTVTLAANNTANNSMALALSGGASLNINMGLTNTFGLNPRFLSSTGLEFKVGNATEASSTTAMVIDSNGNVGFGTITPVSKLDIVGNVGIGTGINSAYVTTTAPTGGMIIEGNVGIGTLIPASKLSIGASTLMQKVTAANTACSTTCGNMGCYFGEDTGVLGTLLDCSDATADVCMCSK